MKQEIRNVVLVLTAAWFSLESQMPFAFHLSNLPGQVLQSPKKGNIVSGLVVVCGDLYPELPATLAGT